MITETKEVRLLSRVELISIQTKLKKLDYYSDEIDGIFGKNTAHAWATFKTDNWLGETTLIGESSYNLLVEKYRELTGVDWTNFNSKISQYFTVGESAQGITNDGRYVQYRERLATNVTHRNNIIRLAKELDLVRDWWGSSLLVTSWYRPPHVERRVGGSGYSHPFGLAADIRPANNDIWTFQKRFEKEWYDTGKWKGGFGRGANRGFTHHDLKNRRKWNY